MKDENGKYLSEEEVLSRGLDLLVDACCLLREIETEEVMALSFMVDYAIVYGSAIRKGIDPRLSDQLIHLLKGERNDRSTIQD